MFEELLAELLRFFDEPPKLDFRRVPENTLLYEFPKIRAGNAYGASASGTEIASFFAEGSKKLEYYHFLNSELHDELTWMNEALVKDAAGYRVQAEAIPDRTPFVNASPETARAWFEGIIAEAAKATTPTLNAFVGDPGAGKSTLLKHLIHLCRPRSNAANVVFTRLEANKFFDYCAEKASQTGEALSFNDIGEHRIVELLTHYVYAITLRDLILIHAYDFRDGGMHLQPNSIFSDRGKLEKLTFLAAEIGGATDEAQQDGFYKFFHGIKKTEIKKTMVFEIDFRLCVGLVSTLSENKKVVIIFDGLDMLSPEDEELDRNKFFVLQVILRIFGLVVPGTRFLPTRFKFTHHAIVVLRPNTLDRLRERINTEVSPIQFPQAARIGRLPADVILYRSIVRGLRVLPSYAGVGGGHILVEAGRLYRSLDMMLRDTAIDFNLPKGDGGMLALFGGNIRDSFKFVERLLFWVRDEGEKFFDGRPSVAALIEFIESPESQYALQRKRYRIYELLLMFEAPTFQNAVITPIAELRANMMREVGTVDHTLSRNGKSTGLVDNIFNYHLMHGADCNNDHNLLQKVRILQLSLEGTLSEWELYAELAKLGYDVPKAADIARMRLILPRDRPAVGIDKSILLLCYVGFLERHDESGVRYYTITAKGRAVVNSLMYESVYLEHVFHKTLIPALLQLSRHVDTARDDGHEQWVIASIRNYFTLLTYIHYIENGVSRGHAIPSKLWVWDDMRQSVISSVQRIMIPDHREKRTRSPSTWWVKLALDEVKKLRDLWDSRGILSPPSPLPVAPP